MKDVDYPDKRTLDEEMAATGIDKKLERMRREATKTPKEKGRKVQEKQLYLDYSPEMESGTEIDDKSDAEISQTSAQDEPPARFLGLQSRSLRRRRYILPPDPEHSEVEANTLVSRGSSQDLQVHSEADQQATRLIEEEERDLSFSPVPEVKVEPASPIEDGITSFHTPTPADQSIDLSRRAIVASAERSVASTSGPERQPKDSKAQHIIVIDDDDEPAVRPRKIARRASATRDAEATIKRKPKHIKLEARQEVVLVEEDVEDMEDMEFQVKKAQIKRAQLQAELEELELKQKMAAMKKRKAENQ